MTLYPVVLIGSTYTKFEAIRERVLNSYLEFIFYTGGTAGDFPIRKFLPFLGDVTVTESRKANYVDYIPISRNSSVPFYTGSESRQFKVTYEISPNFLLQNPGFVDFIKDFKDGLGSGNAEDPTQIFFPNRDPQTVANSFSFKRPYGTDRITEKGVFASDLNEDKLVYSFVDYQINLIRSSVINNAIDPTKGPPVVRLSHGLLYQNIPCICKDYSVEQVFDDSNKKNYHTKYKVSKHKVQISINLQEFRTGDFLQTQFDPASTVSRDNIVGWEQIISGNKSLDPINPIYRS